VSNGVALVTGGAGFIGSVLCRRLLEEGREVVAYDNLSYGREGLLPPAHSRLRLVRGDVRDGAALASLLREHRPEAVFHLAALHFIPYCNAHPAEALDVNLGGTRALLRACREQPPRVLVFASTAAVYPREGSPFREDIPLAPLDVYGHSKASGEDLVRLFGAETGIAVAAARLFNAFGPGDTNPHLVPEVVQQLRATREHPSLRLGNLEPVRDYVHVRDTAAALHALASAASGVEVWNVGSGEGRSVRQVVDAFAAALGTAIPIDIDPERVRTVDRPELVADSTKLRARTGWAPRVAFEDGLRELVEDLRG
jgi:UDP-glucose 4-epimerase